MKNSHICMLILIFSLGLAVIGLLIDDTNHNANDLRILYDFGSMTLVFFTLLSFMFFAGRYAIRKMQTRQTEF